MNLDTIKAEEITNNIKVLLVKANIILDRLTFY